MPKGRVIRFLYKDMDSTQASFSTAPIPTAKSLGKRLIRWYQKYHRDLPWRRRSDPYGIWISEIMLQQTRVETVVEYYQRFMRQFPTVQRLAKARLGQVLKLWEGLGYYSRARHLHQAAKVVMTQYGNVLPNSYDELRTLPGIGTYTAGAILSIAFGRPVPAVDGNVLRVISRVFAVQKDVAQQQTKESITAVVKQIMPVSHASEFNQGLMDLGATVCLPDAPRCPVCPWKGTCRAHRTGREMRFPVKSKVPGPRSETRCVAVIQSRGRCLMRQRPNRRLLAGLWEFPNARAGTKQQFKTHLDRKYGLDVTVGKQRLRTRHVFSHVRWDMKVYDCTLNKTGIVRLQKLRWISARELKRIAIPSAFAKIRQSVFG